MGAPRTTAEGNLARDHRRGGHDGVEMGPGDGGEHDDQDEEAKTRSEAVRKQRNGNIAGRKPLAHDARTDDDSEQ